jgi:hypothetical protein
MSIYAEAMSEPLATGTTPPVSGEMSSGLVAPSSPAADDTSVIAIVRAFQTKQLDVMTTPIQFKVMLAGVALAVLMPCIVEVDYDGFFFVSWLIWVGLWLIALSGCISYCAPTLLGRPPKTACCAAEEWKPWLGMWAWFYGLFVLLAATDGFVDASAGLEVILFCALYSAPIMPLVFAGALLTSSSPRKLGYPITLTASERHTGSLAWTLLLSVVLGSLAIMMCLDWMDQGTNYWVIRGRSNAKATDGEEPFRCASSKDTVHEVRCCSDTYITGYQQRTMQCTLDTVPYAESVFRQKGCIEVSHLIHTCVSKKQSNGEFVGIPFAGSP